MILRSFDINHRGRDFIVGDVHGHYDALMSALDRQDFDRCRDRLFMLGDLVDRGPKSRQCLELLYEPWAFSVMGNHEILMRNALMNPDDKLAEWQWIQRGGIWFFHEPDREEARALALDAISMMPYAVELDLPTDRIGLVHAEPPAEGWAVLRSQHTNTDLRFRSRLTNHVTWSRGKIWKRDSQPITDIDAVVCGHTIVEKPMWLGNVLFIETGVATKRGRLTLLEASTLLCNREKTGASD